MPRTTLHHAGIAAAATLALAVAALAQPANDNCANAIPIANGSVTPFNTQTATRDGVASCMNFSAARDIWFTYTCTSAEHLVLDLCGSGPMTKGLAIFTGGCGGTQLACNRTGGCGTGQPQLVVNTPGPGTYYIYVATLQSSGDFSGILTLNATPLAGQPTSDSCTAPYPVAGNVTAAFNTAGLTTDGTSTCGGLNDAWFAWTPSFTGPAAISTCDLTTGDTVLTAYSGCSGEQIACNDNFCGAASKITFPATAGVPVWVRVASPTGEPVSGNINFFVDLTPSNDTCQNALQLPALGSYPVSTSYATTQGPSGSCNVGGEADSRDLFYRYTAGNEGFITVDTLIASAGSSNPSTANTTLQIFDACGGNQLACNDNAHDGTNAARTCPLAVTPGTSYIIRVAMRGAAAAGASFQLRIAAASEPTWAMPADAITEPGDPCANWIDDPNRGCDNLATPPTQSRTPVVLCQNYKGNAPSRTTPNPYGNIIHDADIYTFTLTEPSIVTVTGQTRFKALASIWSNNCSSYVGQLPVVYPSPCSGVGDFTLTIPDVLQPGEHNFTIGNWFDFNATCGTNDEYWFRITTNHPCPVTVVCPADLGVQGGIPGQDGLLDNNDFVIFIDYFFNANPAADFGVQGGIPGHDGLFDNNDFVVFIDAFFAGCP